MDFKNLLFVFPVMFYYLLEALIVGLFVTIVWKLVLANVIIDIGYFQWVGIYWIVKMLFFDVFKLITGLTSAGITQERLSDDNNDGYNEQFTE